ncbi:hypothetical protein DERF_005940 [Dermatophagoides farinae]|uniref:Uncharacterized protein n=1 Tax=Dermatophagoides farinae TaxID=6954 RepID=A0A922I596_DERFA|nr:hypothetical protein DERF_005940 [Dermatophagoides farinae]
MSSSSSNGRIESKFHDHVIKNERNHITFLSSSASFTIYFGCIKFDYDVGYIRLNHIRFDRHKMMHYPLFNRTQSI